MARGRRLTAALLGGVAVAAIAVDAMAAEKENQLEELVVTARRTAESAQSVPLAVTAIGEAAIREKSITSPTELMFNVPSVNIVTLFGRLTGDRSGRDPRIGSFHDPIARVTA